MQLLSVTHYSGIDLQAAESQVALHQLHGEAAAEAASRNQVGCSLSVSWFPCMSAAD